MAYGFKLFEVYSTQGPTRTTRQDLGTGVCQHTSAWEWVQRQAQTLEGLARPVTGLPNLNHPGDWTEPAPARRDPRIKFESHETARHPQHVFLKVKYGFHNEFDLAIGNTAADDVDLTDRSPVGTFRALYLFPDEGPYGRLAVETAGSRCPVNLLTAWLGQAAYEDAGTTGDWSRLRLHPLIDGERLQEMATSAESFETIFTESDPSSANRNSSTYVLTHKVKTVAKRKEVAKELGRWLKAHFVDGTDTTDGHVARLQEIVGLDLADLNRGGLHFDDAKIKIVENGQTKTLTPATLNKTFTYQVSEDLPVPDSAWRDAVYARLSGTLSDGTDIQL